MCEFLLAPRTEATQFLLLTLQIGKVSECPLGRAEEQAGSPHLACLDHLLQGLQPLHTPVLHGHGQEHCSVPGFLRHKRHQVLCKDVDERLVKGTTEAILTMSLFPPRTHLASAPVLNPHPISVMQQQVWVQREAPEHSRPTRIAKPAPSYLFSRCLLTPWPLCLSLI